MLLSRGYVDQSLTYGLSTVENHLTTLNFTNTASGLFAESVTVLFLFRTWTDFGISMLLAVVLVSHSAAYPFRSFFIPHTPLSIFS
jgi:hypothetical protein